MKRFHFFTLLIMSVLLATTAVQCAPAATPAPTATPAPPSPTPVPTEAKPVELTLWTWKTPDVETFVNGRLEVFQKENPGAKVIYSAFPSTGEGGYEDKILTSLATGTGPDVFFIVDAQTPRYASKGQIQPIDDAALKAMGFGSLDDLMKAYDYKPGALDGWSWEGQPYALLFEVSWLSLYANTDMMEDSGIDPATVKLETWDDVIAAAEKMSRFDDKGNFTREGFDLPTYGDDTWCNMTMQVFLSQTGGSLVSPDGKEAWINKPEAIEAFQQMVKIVRGSKAGNPDFGSPGIGGLYLDWFAGKNTAMSLWHPPFWKAISTADIRDHYKVYPMPTMADGRAGNVMWGWGWVVNAASTQKELAWKLVHALTSDFEAVCSTVGNWLPLEDLMDYPCVQENLGREGLVASLDRNPQFMLRSVYYPEITRIARAAYERVIFEGEDLQAAMDQAAKEINEVLARGD